MKQKRTRKTTKTSFSAKMNVPLAFVAITILATVLITTATTRIISANSANEPNLVTDITTSETTTGTKIIVQTSSKPRFSIFKLKRPERLNIDIALSSLSRAGSSSAAPLEFLEVNSWAIGQIMTSELKTERSPTTRIMVSLRRDATYTAKVSGNQLIIDISALDPKPTATAQSSLPKNTKLARTAEKNARELEQLDNSVVKKSQFHQSISGVKDSLANARSSLQGLKSELESSKKHLADMNAKQIRLIEELTHLKNRRYNVKTDRHLSQKQRSSKETQMAAQIATLEKIIQQKATQQSGIENELRLAFRKQRVDIDRLKGEISNLSSDRSKGKSASHSKSYTTGSQHMSFSPQELSALKNDLGSLQSDLQAMNAEFKHDLEQSQSLLEGRQSVLEKKFGGAESKIETLAAKTQHLEKSNLSRDQKILALTKTLDSLQTSINKDTNSKPATTSSHQTTPSISDIKYIDKANRSAVQIRFKDITRRPIVSKSKNGIYLTFKDTTLGNTKLEQHVDTSEFNGPIERITTRRIGTHEIKVSLAMSAEADPKLDYGDKSIRISFKKHATQLSSAKSPLSSVGSKKNSYAEQQVNPLDAIETVHPPIEVGGSVASRTLKGERKARRRRYRGRRVDLDFKDANIHNVLRLISEVGNVNIITSDAVQGSVTIRMRNVPWDQALAVILRAKGLGQVRDGNLLRIAPISDLEKEREAEIARQKQMTQLEPTETRLIPLSYAQAEQILPKLQYTLSPRGKLTFDERTNMVIAHDLRANLKLMEEMIRNLDTQTPQVVIEARIVEARSNFTKEIGVQWGGNFQASAASGNSTGLVFPNQIGIGGGSVSPQDNISPTSGLLLGQAANPNFAVNLPASSGLGSGGALGLTLGSVSGALNINLRLSALESKGNIKIISAPKITTLDNVESRIEQGVTLPFSQISAQGVQTQFRDAKLSLRVKPHVTADGSVIMKVMVERNEPDFANTGPQGEPTILKKEAETEMLVKDGDTAVIGGIYTTRDGRSESKVPWLGDIPLLGWFFRSKSSTSEREEVLVFITPRIINRAQSIGL